MGAVLAQCWPVLGALFFSGTFFVLAFPFFTYVPSGGTFGQDLAKVGNPLLFHTSSARPMSGMQPTGMRRGQHRRLLPAVWQHVGHVVLSGSPGVPPAPPLFHPLSILM